jgi:hypothetical protein
MPVPPVVAMAVTAPADVPTMAAVTAVTAVATTEATVTAAATPTTAATAASFFGIARDCRNQKHRHCNQRSRHELFHRLLPFS